MTKNTSQLVLSFSKETNVVTSYRASAHSGQCQHLRYIAVLHFSQRPCKADLIAISNPQIRKHQLRKWCVLKSHNLKFRVRSINQGWLPSETMMLAVSVTHHRCDLSLASYVARLLLQHMINEPRSWQVAPRNSGIVSVHGLFPECVFLAEQGQGPNMFACFFLLESQVMGTHVHVKRNACVAS